MRAIKWEFQRLRRIERAAKGVLSMANERLDVSDHHVVPSLHIRNLEAAVDGKPFPGKRRALAAS